MAERLDSALHIGSADAREGGGFGPRPTTAAEAERDRIFEQFARYRMSLGGESFIGPIDVRHIRSEVSSHFETALSADPAARDLATGIIGSERGNPRAAIEYAIARENTAMALRYLRRMDRGQIDDLIADWNRRYPRGPGLYERLGLFQHHWSVTNWNGAVFSGDEANELEIAMMGVPRNDRERAEVALRTMNQQMEQSTGLGRLVAGDEYDRLVANRDALLRLIGHDNGDLDSQGRLRVRDPITGETLGLGNFDSNGNFLPTRGRSGTAFERAVALARFTATDFTQAVDAAANFFTTLLVVVAAVVTTALTGGAAASIWIPMLVTAAAGLAGVAMTAALKGGRYSRDEVVRDLVMVAVQTLTAGIGAAGSVAARGGLPALRAVASRGISSGFRISERALERFVASKGGSLAASASFGAELGIAAASGAVSGGVTAAIDPANRRSENYGERILGGIFRGAAGAAVGAGVARGAAAGLGSAGNRLAAASASRSARSALASGLSREQAIERALLAARRANWVASGITRSVSSGASGSASRMTELGLEGRASLEEILTEGRTAFLQNALQGAAEHGVDSGVRNPFRSSRNVTESDLRAMPSWQRQEHEHMRAMAAEMVANTYDPPAPAAAAPQAARPAGPVDETVPARPRAPAPAEADPARPRASTIADPASSKGLPLRLQPDDETTVIVRAAAPDEESAPPIPGRARDDEQDHFYRSNLRGDDDEPRPDLSIPPITFAEHAALDVLPRGNQAQRVIDSVDLTPTMLRAARSLPEGSIIRPRNPKDRAAAERNYQLMLQNDIRREVLLAYHPQSGEYAVVQGGRGRVKPMGEGWVTERHSHPLTDLPNERAEILHALPSLIPGDIMELIGEARVAQARPENGGVGVRISKIDVVQPDGSITETTFAIRLAPEGMQLTVTFTDPRSRALRPLGPFTDLLQYNEEVIRLTGRDLFKSPPPAEPGSYSAGSGGFRRGPPVSAEDRAEAHFINQRMSDAEAADLAARARGVPVDPATRPGAARAAEAHAAVRRLGLVGEPDSLARLTALINDPDLPLAVRSAVANATLEATRAEMRRSGALTPGDDVVLLMRGVTAARLGDYGREGIDLAHLPRKTTSDDASRGLYGSQDFESAHLYTAPHLEGGQVLPLIVRKSELGNIIDVRTGSPLGERWLQFIRANRGSATVAPRPGYEHLSGILFPGVPMPYALEGAGRGARFEAFLKSLADDPSLPDSLRAAARDPHITFMDLGGVASTGTDRRVLTDQWAMHSQHIADMFNRAHGFPVPGREGPGGVSPARPPAEGEYRSALAPQPPQREPGPTARLAAGLLDNLIARGHDPDGHLADLRRLAPETTDAFFTRVIDETRRGGAPVLSEREALNLSLELRGRGVPAGMAADMVANFRRFAAPDHPVYLRMIEAAPQSRFYRGLTGALRAAFERRAAIETARRFGRTKGSDEDRLLVKRLVQSDPDAVANFIRSGDSLDERVAAYARERVAQGERFQDAQSDGYALARVIETSEFGKVRDRVNRLLARVDRAPRTLADLVREQPDALLSLAHTSPQLLSELYVDLIFKRMSSRKQKDGTILPADFTTPAAARLLGYVGTRLISNVLPVASEISVVWSLKEMGLTMLKADSAQAGGANRPGLDIVAFGRLNGRDPTTGGPVRLMIADDKAYQKRDIMGINELQSVSAMQGPRFARNLRTTAQEIRDQIRQLELLGLADKPGYPEYLAGARAAIRQMVRAAGEIERIPGVPTTREARKAHIRTEAYARAVAVILARHHIEQVITSRHGNINALAKWLRWQGFLLEDEYLLRLWAMMAIAARSQS